jgi:hypothetical protein
MRKMKFCKLVDTSLREHFDLVERAPLTACVRYYRYAT